MGMEELETMIPFGLLKFQKDGNTLHQGFTQAPVLQWQKGKMEIVYPKDIATSQMAYPILSAKKR